MRPLALKEYSLQGIRAHGIWLLGTLNGDWLCSCTPRDSANDRKAYGRIASYDPAA